MGAEHLPDAVVAAIIGLGAVFLGIVNLGSLLVLFYCIKSLEQDLEGGFDRIQELERWKKKMQRAATEFPQPGVLS